MTTRLEALEAEIALRMKAVSMLAQLAEAGSVQAPKVALDLIAEIEALDVEAAVERARPEL